MVWALAFALANAGRSIPAKIAMIAMTTNSSMRVKAPSFGLWVNVPEKERLIWALMIGKSEGF
jgi:hypothetical protein